MTINGKKLESEQLRLIDYLRENDYKTDIIAVECNEKIVPKSQYESFVIYAKDVVEIVSFVGGG